MSFLLLLICTILILSKQSCKSADCADNFDCALYGECVNGICECDIGWKGKHCTTLDILPTPLNSGFTYNVNTWGGSPIAINNNFYILATLIGSGDPELIWCMQATIVLAQATQPQGPYKYIESIINSSSVNCTGVINPVIISLHNNEGYLLYYTCAQCHNDINATQRCEDTKYCPNSLRVSYTKNNDLSDTTSWIHKEYELFAPNVNNWEGGIADNPGPVALANNSILMAYRGADDTAVGLVYADIWSQNPYIRENNGGLLFPNRSGLEDPIIWQSSKGYHMLLHNCGGPQNTDVGTIAWSTDGVNWRLNKLGEGVYGHTIYYEDGTNISCTRREEPKLLFQNNIPTYLANVCYHGSDQIFVSMVPIKTK